MLKKIRITEERIAAPPGALAEVVRVQVPHIRSPKGLRGRWVWSNSREANSSENNVTCCISSYYIKIVVRILKQGVFHFWPGKKKAVTKSCF